MSRAKPITHLPDPQAFWSKVDVRGPDECWEWIPRGRNAGYGFIRIGETGVFPAHRIAYALVNGIPEPDDVIRHTCDNPPCCNPNHLLNGTHADNAQDRERRNRRDLYAPSRIAVLSRGNAHWAHKEPDRVRRGDACPQSPLTSSDVTQIRTLWELGNMNQPQLAEQYGVAVTAINQIVNRKTWQHQDHGIPTTPRKAPPKRYTKPDSTNFQRGSDRPASRLTEDAVREIRRLHAAKVMTIAAMASRFGVSTTTIKLITSRRAWAHVEDE